MVRLVLIALCFAASLVGAPPELRVATLLDGPSRYLEEQRDVIEFEIYDLLGNEYSVLFPPDSQLVGDWTTASVLDQLNQQLADPAVDVVLTVGLLSSHVAAMRGDLNKPVLASSMLMDQLPPGQTEIANLAYVASPIDLERDMEALYQLVPFDRMAILVDRELYEQLHLSPTTLDPYRERYGAEFDILLVDEDPVAALDQMSSDTDVIYIAPPYRSDQETFARLIDEINRRGLPSFSMVGEDEVKEGVMLGLAPGSDLPRLGRRMALNLQRVLFGEDPASIPTQLGTESRLSFNQETAAQIGYSPPWEIYTEALLFGDLPDGQILSLCGAFRWVCSVNPEIWASRYSTWSGCGEVEVARARLLPQLGVGMVAREIDRSRAREGLGRTPERLVELGARFEQSIFSDSRWAGFQIEQSLQCGRMADLRRVTLDVLFDVGTAYINLLSRRALLDIERQNLELTRQNLAFAEARVEIGTSRMNEIYRWESQLATNKEAVVNSEAEVRIAEAELNRLLHRPTLCPVYTDERTLEDLLRALDHPRLTELISTPEQFDWFTEYEIWQGWQRSPELAFVRSSLNAQCRRLLSDERSYYLPDVDFVAETQQRVVRGGAGMSATEISPLLVTRSQLNDWLIAFRATFPLFEGGAKRGRVRRDSALVRELCQEFKRVSDLVARNVSVALDRGLASFLSIDLAADALKAAIKNLRFVEDAYAKGTASILDLLDAQETALEAARGNVFAGAEFALDMVLLGRAVGRFDFLCSPEERERWLSDLSRFIEQKQECR